MKNFLRYTINMVPVSPFSVNTKISHGNFRPTTTFIPGRAIRGALAAYWADRCDLLAQGVYSGDIKVFDARHNTTEGYSYPIPHSLRTCKRFPGFRKNDKEHGAHDVLTDLLKSRISGESINLRCKKCQNEWNSFNPLQKFDGHTFQSCHKDGKSIYNEVAMLLGRQTHTAIDRYSGTQASGFLYEEEHVITRSSDYSENNGWKFPVLLTEELAKDLKNSLYKAKIRIGASKTSGKGVFEVVSIEPEKSDWNLPPLEERLTNFNKAVGYSETEWFLPVFFVSHSIIPDFLGCFSSTPSIEMFWKSIGINKHDLIEKTSVVISLSELDKFSGWNSLPGLPAPMDLALQAGSILVLKIKEIQMKECLPILQKAEKEGVGFRTEEGCGAVVFAHPIHLEVKDHAV